MLMENLPEHVPGEQITVLEGDFGITVLEGDFGMEMVWYGHRYLLLCIKDIHMMPLYDGYGVFQSLMESCFRNFLVKNQWRNEEDPTQGVEHFNL